MILEKGLDSDFALCFVLWLLSLLVMLPSNLPGQICVKKSRSSLLL